MSRWTVFDTSELKSEDAVYSSSRHKGQTLLETDDAVQELIALCTDDSTDAQLRELLSQPRWEAVATAKPHWIHAVVGPGQVLARPSLNLQIMVERAAEAVRPACLKTLLSFGAAHDLPGTVLVDPYTFFSTIKSTAAAAVLLDFAPSLVSCRLGRSGRTRDILEYAVSHYSPDSVALLLDRGARPSDLPAEDDSGHPARPLLWAAAYRGSYKMTKLLLDRGLPLKESAALHGAAVSGSTRVMALLLEHGADVNERLGHVPFYLSLGHFASSWTPMHAAAAQGNVDAMAWLTSHGADPDIRDEQNRTPDEILSCNLTAPMA